MKSAAIWLHAAYERIPWRSSSHFVQDFAEARSWRFNKAIPICGDAGFTFAVVYPGTRSEP